MCKVHIPQWFCVELYMGVSENRVYDIPHKIVVVIGNMIDNPK